MLNLNLSLKVKDWASPLSGNAVKVPSQIKSGLFDLPNIVFPLFGTWRMSRLSLIPPFLLFFSSPSLSFFSHTSHTDEALLFAAFGMLGVQ